MRTRLLAVAVALSMPLATAAVLAPTADAATKPKPKPDCPKYPTKYDVDHEDEKVTRKADDADGKRVYAVRITGKVSRGNRGCHSRGPVFHTDIYKYHSAFTNADGFAGTTFTAAREDFEWWVTYGGSSSSHHIFRTADFRSLNVGGSS